MQWQSFKLGSSNFVILLLSGFNPTEKYACQIGSFLQIGVKKIRYEAPWKMMVWRLLSSLGRQLFMGYD